MSDKHVFVLAQTGDVWACGLEVGGKPCGARVTDPVHHVAEDIAERRPVVLRVSYHSGADRVFHLSEGRLSWRVSTSSQALVVRPVNGGIPRVHIPLVGIREWSVEPL